VTEPVVLPWIGEFKSEWRVVPNKAVIKPKKQSVGVKADEYDLLSLTKQGVIVRNLDEGGKFPENFDSYQRVEPGDLVTCLFDVEETPRTIGISKHSGMITGAYDVFEFKGDVNPRFFEYFYLALDQRKGLKYFYSGLRNVIRTPVFLSIPMPLPPRADQDAIVEFLDREIAQIDTAVEKQRQLSTLLLERRQSLINAAVRFGIKSEEVREFSTISWIGSYSKRFSIQRLKHNTYLKARVGWKGLTSDEFQLDSFAYLVTGSDFRGKYVKWDDCYQVDDSRYLDDPFIHLVDGDLLVTKDGSIGKLALVSGLDKPACLNSGVFLMRPKHSYSNTYMYWLLSSDIFREFVNLTSYGSTIQHLYQNVFENFSFPLPDLREQLEIVEYLEEKTDQIAVMIEKSEKLVEVLSQRKLSLIGAAVTGKINLGGVQKLG